MTPKIFFHVHQPLHLPVDIKYDSIQNIDNYNSKTLDSVMIGDLLDYYEPKHIPDLLNLIVDKLRTGGTIEIQGPDISELCISSASNQVDIDTVRSILYNRKFIYTIYDIENLLIRLDINQKKYINIFEYYISATKHEE